MGRPVQSNSEKLEQWFAKQQRLLPWRRHYRPYEIWVSEIMLQQTQVATAVPYFKKFIRAFPSIKKLAAAKQETVLENWSGLGYYSRARNLHRGAAYLVEHHKGQLPQSCDELLKVPGIGPYTAGAIASIAFNQREALVDGNVQRVFSRFYGIGSPLESSATQKRYWEIAGDWVKNALNPRDLNQALMELGATVCKKSQPDCPACPIQRECVARKAQTQALYPPPKKRKKSVSLYWLGLVQTYNGKYYLEKNPAGTWWETLWDFPRIEAKTESDIPKRISSLLKQNEIIESCRPIKKVKHTVTHHKITMVGCLIHLSQKTPVAHQGEGKWFTQKQMNKLAKSSLVSKILN